jgi:hypothetical protein
MQSEEFYKQNNGLLRYYDYNFARYDISFSTSLVKLNVELVSVGIDFDSIIRYSDKHIKIDEIYHFFIFLKTDIKSAFQALMGLEKNIISKYNLYNFDRIFKASVASKEKDRDIKEMIRICFELINECKKNQNILTEDDL